MKLSHFMNLIAAKTEFVVGEMQPAQDEVTSGTERRYNEIWTHTHTKNR